MNRIRSISIIVLGSLLLSLITNIAQHRTIEALKYKIQKIEAGPAKSIFDKTEDQIIPDEKMRDIIKQMLDKMFDEQRKKDII